MNESAKTLTFTVVAIALAGGALASYRLNQPTDDAKFSLVGKTFFEDFESSSDATELEVVTVDPESMSPVRLSVKNDKGIWRIPSHHNYPAEATDRLAETATSAMGITRASLEGTASDFQRLGVIDPLEIDAIKTDDPTGIGNRFTLRDANGEPLVDLIIGKSAGEAPRSPESGNVSTNPTTYYYVRRPDEQLVYKAQININLSTRFSDWIDSDLLRVDSARIVRLKVDNYDLKEQAGGFPGQVNALIKEQGDKVSLNRKSFTDAWELVGLNQERDEINLTRVQSTLEILSDLTIAGVRPKFKFKNHLLLTPDLKFNLSPELKENPQETQEALLQFQDELEDRGFSLTQGEPDKLVIASANGELQIGTGDGVQYSLHIGRTIEGTEKEIEIGGAKSVDDVDTEEEKQKIANYQEGEKSRYVMVRVAFDESLLGDRPIKPVPPVEPTKPDGYTPPEKTESKAQDKTEPTEEEKPATDPEKQEGDEKEVDQPEIDTKAEVKQDGIEEKKPAQTRDIAFDAYDAAMAVHGQQKIEHEIGLTRFDEELKDFESRAVEGKKLVSELNERFGDWYYVIRGSNLRTLKLKQSDVVQPRRDLKQESPPTNPRLPDFNQAVAPDGKMPELKFEPSDSTPDSNKAEGVKADEKIESGNKNLGDAKEETEEVEKDKEKEKGNDKPEGENKPEPEAKPGPKDEPKPKDDSEPKDDSSL